MASLFPQGLKKRGQRQLVEYEAHLKRLILRRRIVDDLLAKARREWAIEQMKPEAEQDRVKFWAVDIAEADAESTAAEIAAVRQHMNELRAALNQHRGT